LQEAELSLINCSVQHKGSGWVRGSQNAHFRTQFYLGKTALSQTLLVFQILSTGTYLSISDITRSQAVARIADRTATQQTLVISRDAYEIK